MRKKYSSNQGSDKDRIATCGGVFRMAINVCKNPKLKQNDEVIFFIFFLISSMTIIKEISYFNQCAVLNVIACKSSAELIIRIVKGDNWTLQNQQA